MKRKLTAADLLPSREDFEEAGCPYVPARKAGYATSEEGESGYAWAVFPLAQVVQAFGEITPENASDVACNLTGWAASYSGPGRGFRHDPYIRVMKRNVIVKQFCGLDI